MAKHLIAIFLIVAVPIWDHFETKRLKTSRDPRVKIQSYQKTVGWLWAGSVVACLVLGLRTVLTIHRDAGEASWLPGSGFVIGFMGAALVALFLPIFLMMRSEITRARIAKSLEKLNFILPQTAEERRWFVLVAITAGVCEEILYRGFLIHYFRELPGFDRADRGADSFILRFWVRASLSGRRGDRADYDPGRDFRPYIYRDWQSAFADGAARVD